jgi:hypothetical protein
MEVVDRASGADFLIIQQISQSRYFTSFGLFKMDVRKQLVSCESINHSFKTR